MPRIKVEPEDFVVEEIPAYEPSGSGDHLYVTFTKRGWTTPAAVDAIAREVGVPAREIGVAGLKDKIAVTTQTISLPMRAGLEERVRALAIEGVTIGAVARHGNKLKTGHLRGNRFMVRVRELGERRDEVERALRRIGVEGLPNAFGAQRFGREGDNASRARAWVIGEAPPPRDARFARLMLSALQAAVFNEVLRRRVADGTWSTCLVGDLVKRRDSGGLFLCTDEQEARERASRGEVTATGPIFGAKMRPAEGAPGALERLIFEEIVGSGVDLKRVARYGEGSRRALCLWVEELRVEPEEGDSLRVYFVLPKGAYATTVIAAATGLEPSMLEQGSARDGADQTEETTE